MGESGCDVNEKQKGGERERERKTERKRVSPRAKPRPPREIVIMPLP